MAEETEPMMDFGKKKKKKKQKVVIDDAEVAALAASAAVTAAPTSSSADVVTATTAQKPEPRGEGIVGGEGMGGGGGGGGGGGVGHEAVPMAVETADQTLDGMDPELADLMKSKKKKKKKDKPALVVPEVPTAEPKIEEAAVEKAFVEDFELPKKKKRKKQNITFEGFDVSIIEMEGDDEKLVKEGGEENDDLMEQEDMSPWTGTDRDYTYEELLERVFNIMREKNPNAGGPPRKLVMKPPQVVRVGAKKTSFVNFTEICKILHRQPKHLLAFLMAELGTSGSVDGNNQLIIKGKFQQKQIETVLRRYIKEYVTCHTCRSPNTILQKETRLFFLQCETCGSRCSVASIKSGFQAVTGHRAHLRQRQQ